MAKRDSSAAGRRVKTDRDSDTRERLLQAAARLFAERSFAKVTVRDIARKAKANVAAVNYHFGDKAGLYDHVIMTAIRVMQGTTAEARAAGEGRKPEEQIEVFVSVFLQRVFEGREGWIHQLMVREMAEPTPALDAIVKQVLKPRTEYLAGVIATLMGCAPDDARVAKCVISVHAQCLAVRDNPVSRRFGMGPLTTEGVQDFAKHIARFSVAGIRAIARA